jgi:hypothetical protein
MHAVGIIALANAIPNMEAISSINLLQNNLNTDQAGALVSMLKKHPTLKSLCGNEGDETELEMSSKMSGAGDAIMLVAEIVDNGALLHFDISENDIRADGGKALMEALKGNQVITTLSIAKNNLSANSSGDNDMSGVVALADAIPGMRAMTSLNLSGSGLGAEGATHIAEGIKVSKCVAAVVLVPFLCPSDHWLNCCCLLLSTG